MKYRVANPALQQAVTSAEQQMQEANESLRGVGLNAPTYARVQPRLRVAVAKAYAAYAAAKRALRSAETTLYDSPESAAAAIADAMNWPGFCLGEWARIGGVDACCVYASESDRDASLFRPTTSPRIWAVA